MAKIAVSPKLRLDLIAIAAGQPDEEKRIYRDGYLEVQEVGQDALEAAINHPSVLNPIVIPKQPTLEERIAVLEQEIIKLRGEK